MSKVEIAFIIGFCLLVCYMILFTLYAFVVICNEWYKHRTKEKARAMIKKIFVKESDTDIFVENTKKQLEVVLSEILYVDKELKEEFSDIPKLLSWFLSGLINEDTKKKTKNIEELKNNVLHFWRLYDNQDEKILDGILETEQIVLKDLLCNCAEQEKVKRKEIVVHIADAIRRRDNLINTLQFQNKKEKTRTKINFFITVVSTVITVISMLV